MFDFFDFCLPNIKFDVGSLEFVWKDGRAIVGTRLYIGARGV